VARSEMPQIFLLAYFLFISQFTFVLHIDFNSDLVRETPPRPQKVPIPFNELRNRWHQYINAPPFYSSRIELNLCRNLDKKFLLDSKILED